MYSSYVIRREHIFYSCLILCSFFSKILFADDLDDQAFRIRVGIEEVRIDAVVLDKNGRQIDSLTADDFELYQDGKMQKLISCSYISEIQESTNRKSYDAFSLNSTPMIKKDHIRRTIAFLIDDNSMSFEHIHYTRMALRKYVESQMQSGDVVGILRTSDGSGRHQQFSSDKRLLLSAINRIRWGIGTFAGESGGFTNIFPVSGYGNARNPPAGLTMNSAIAGIGNAGEAPDYKVAQSHEAAKMKYIYEAQIGGMRFFINALQDLPGRKYLFLISPFTTFTVHYQDPTYYQNRYIQIYNKLADEALRADVVVHTLDINGLDFENPNIGGAYLPLSNKTGGIILENSNFFLHGIGRAEEQLKGYYLLSYIPPANTFEGKNRSSYHRIKVKVKRGRTEVHSRDGFYGIVDSLKKEESSKAVDLQKAIFAPFRYNDLDLTLTAEHLYSKSGGYFIQSWLHLKGSELTFAEEANGKYSISLELITMTAESDGRICDSKSYSLESQYDREQVERIRSMGIDVHTILPIAKPGDYYVRAALRDRASGYIGSGYYFLQIPNIQKCDLCLSSIFILDHSETANGIETGNLSSMDKELKATISGQSRALHKYASGEELECLVMVYESQANRSNAKLEYQYSILNDNGKEVQRYVNEIFEPQETSDGKENAIRTKLRLSDGMEEGRYTIKLMVYDNNKKKRIRSSIQAISVDIYNR